MTRLHRLGGGLVIGLACALLLAGCGSEAGGAEEDDAGDAEPANVSAETPPASIPEPDEPPRAAGAASESPPPVKDRNASDRDGDPAEAHGQKGPDLNVPPDACALLTREDAAELLGASVGDGRSADIAGLANCAYRTEGGELLALILQLGPDDRVESTQFAMGIDHCGDRAVARTEDLGVASALFDRPPEPCGGGLVLWVASGLRFEGRTHPDLIRPRTGRIHLLFWRNPAGEPSQALPVLRDAAERVLSRLTD